MDEGVAPLFKAPPTSVDRSMPQKFHTKNAAEVFFQDVGHSSVLEAPASTTKQSRGMLLIAIINGCPWV